MKQFEIRLSEQLERDVGSHLRRLRQLESDGAIRKGYTEIWYARLERALMGLETLAERHPWAPERDAWRREVRNALFEDYRVLYTIEGQAVWALRVRHQRQLPMKRLAH